MRIPEHTTLRDVNKHVVLGRLKYSLAFIAMDNGKAQHLDDGFFARHMVSGVRLVNSLQPWKASYAPKETMGCKAWSFFLYP